MVVDYYVGSHNKHFHKRLFPICKSQKDRTVISHPFTSIYIHLHPFTSTYIHLHPFTSTCIHLHPFTSIYIHLHPFTTIFTGFHRNFIGFHWCIWGPSTSSPPFTRPFESSSFHGDGTKQHVLVLIWCHLPSGYLT